MWGIASNVFAGTVQLPQTGQTKCYDTEGAEIACTGTGQDGEILAGVDWPTPRFTDNTDGTMTDNLTGLMWTKDGDAPGPYGCHYIEGHTISSKTCSGTFDYIACINAINYLGYSDWRLPNINELENLVNAENSKPGTYLFAQSFTNVQNWYWSSTTSAENANYAWSLDLVDGGRVLYDEKGWGGNYVWPVRFGQGGVIFLPKTGQASTFADGDDGDVEAGMEWPSPRFIDNQDGTITDDLTGLMWTKDGRAPGPGVCIPVSSRGWQSALNYVSCLNTNNYLGYTDWRLPNRKELRSLINFGQSNSATWLSTQGFNNVMDGSYWSSTTIAAATDSAWSIEMSSGYSADYFCKDCGSSYPYYLYVWPVRSGQIVQPDTTPDPFTFADQTSVALSTLKISNTITVSGINASASISITGGEYSINGGSFISSAGTVNNGNTVRVRLTSSSSYYTTTNATLTIGGVSDTFSVTLNPRFTVNGDCVMDNLTGLMWPRNGNLADSMIKDSADVYYNSLTLCGYDDWRLPDVIELKSLVNADESNTATWLNTQGFYNVQSDPYYYWSSSGISSSCTWIYPPSKGYWVYVCWKVGIVEMSRGNEFYVYKEYERSNYVWPVRTEVVGGYFCDYDNDGYFSSKASGPCIVSDCIPAGCQVTSGTDCKDNDSSVNPDATEGPFGSSTCSDGIDNDCDGKTDSNDSDCIQQCVTAAKITYYRDADGDGYGDKRKSLKDCTQPANYVTNKADCDDNDPNEHPDQVWYKDKDKDKDGYSDGKSRTSCKRPKGYKLPSELTAISGDCKDNNKKINPGSVEGPAGAPTCKDKKGNDCDGLIDALDADCF